MASDGFVRMMKHPYIQLITCIGWPRRLAVWGIGRMKRQSLLASLGFVAFFSLSDAAWPATAPPLGAVQRFGVLGATAVTASNPAFVTGDVGSSPTPSITGSITVDPAYTLHATNDAVVQQAQLDATAAVSAMTPQACTADLTGQDLGTVGTLTPGVYCFTAAAGLTGTLTLNGAGVYIFKTGTTLTTAGASIVALSNGADSGAVFWQVGSAAILGVSSTFKGTIFANTSIGLGTSANLVGRVVAQTGSVTLDSNTVSLPPLPSITVLKSVQTYSDPVNATANPKAIPGSEMTYTITVMNSGAGTVDTGTTVINDPIPANMSICVSTLCSNPPVVFSCSAVPACGLTYSYATAVTYSIAGGGGAPFTYTPVPDAAGYDAAVTGVQITPAGVFNGASGGNNPSFSLSLRMKIK